MRTGILVAALLLSIGAAGAAPGDLARAEEYFQRGLKAESMGDAAFARWVRTIRVAALDQHADRMAFAIDQFANATRLNPAHWGAHKHLGRLYVRFGGNEEAAQLAICHLIAYLAIKPTDSYADAAKDLLDSTVYEYTRFLDFDRRFEYVRTMGRLQDAANLEEFRGFVAGFGEMSGRQLGRLTPVSAATAGTFGDLQSKGLAFHDAMTGLYRSRLDTAGDTLSGDKLAIEEAVTRSANFVSSYLYFIGSMHRFMEHLRMRRIAYDPRLPNALIGESVTQLRRLYTLQNGYRVNIWEYTTESSTTAWRGHSIQAFWIEPDEALVSDEYARLADLGDITVDDLWDTRDYTRPLPDNYIDSGAVEQPGRDRQAYRAVAAASNLNIPDYQSRPEEEWGTWNEGILAACDVVAYEASKEWAKWRHLHLVRCAEMYGLAGPDEVFVRDYIRVGSGEITRWQAGPMGRAEMTVTQADDRDWLVAAAGG